MTTALERSVVPISVPATDLAARQALPLLFATESEHFSLGRITLHWIGWCDLAQPVIASPSSGGCILGVWLGTVSGEPLASVSVDSPGVYAISPDQIPMASGGKIILALRNNTASAIRVLVTGTIRLAQ